MNIIIDKVNNAIAYLNNTLANFLALVAHLVFNSKTSSTNSLKAHIAAMKKINIDMLKKMLKKMLYCIIV